MSRELALWAEWLWSQGAQATPLTREKIARLYLQHLAKQFPQSRAHRATALLEIENDLWKIFLKLGYGGRSPQVLAASRKSYLNAHPAVNHLQVYLNLKGFQETTQAA